jgi:hypothetical protein
LAIKQGQVHFELKCIGIGMDCCIEAANMTVVFAGSLPPSREWCAKQLLPILYKQ